MTLCKGCAADFDSSVSSSRTWEICYGSFSRFLKNGLDLRKRNLFELNPLMAAGAIGITGI